MVRPSRMIVIASAICSISLSLWRDDDRGDALCPAARAAGRAGAAESSSLSAAVGSSRISSLTSLDSALAISTSCCLPTPMSLIRVSGFSSQADPGQQLAAPGGWSRFQSITPRVARLVAEEDVLGDRQLGHQRQLLVDDHDAGVLAVADVR